jgi:hypothetical protein
MLPRAQRVSSRVPRRGLGPLMSSRQQGPTQASSTLGGAVHHPRSAPTRYIQDPVRGREGRLQLMEHQTPVPIYP